MHSVSQCLLQLLRSFSVMLVVENFVLCCVLQVEALVGVGEALGVGVLVEAGALGAVGAEASEAGAVVGSGVVAGASCCCRSCCFRLQAGLYIVTVGCRVQDLSELLHVHIKQHVRSTFFQAFFLCSFSLQASRSVTSTSSLACSASR
jgi:hypothetical protein